MSEWINPNDKTQAKYLPHIGEAVLFALPGAQPELNLADPAVQKRLAAQWGYVPAGEQGGWLRAIDEALVVTHLGVANESDTYEQAREKLNSLIGWHTDVATDPAVNGGWKLVPIEETPKMRMAGLDDWQYGDKSISSIWRDMLAAAPNERSESPEAKP